MEIKIMKMDNGYELFVNSVLVKKGKVLAHIRKMANEIIFDSEETIRVESNLPEINTKYKGYRIYSSPLYVNGVNNGQLFERTWDELLDIINNQNKPMDKRTEVDELY